MRAVHVTLVLVLVLVPTTLGITADRPTYTALQVGEPPQVDGELDDPAWRDAAVLEGFLSGSTSEPAQFATRVRLVYDAQALYIAAVCDDPDPTRLTGAKYEDEVWSADCVEVFLDPQATRRRYYQYIVSADAKVASAFNGDFAAELPADAATGVLASSWTAELRIPFSAFGTAPGLGERWGLLITRARNGKTPDERREVTLWTPTGGNHGKPERFGDLLFSAAAAELPPRAEPDLAVIDVLLARIAEEAHGNWRWTRKDVDLRAWNQRAERMLALNPLLSIYPDKRLLHFVRPAIRDDPLLPWSVPALSEIGGEIALVATRGEFESVLLGLFAVQPITGLRLEWENLVAAGGDLLPATAIEAFHVISWYQAGAGTLACGSTTLVPELLMRDPSLVTVDPTTRTNTLHFDPIPKDAETLQSIDLRPWESHAIWIDVRPPRDTLAGEYRGSLTLRDSQGVCSTVPFRVRVPVWDLAPSPMLHGLYYGRRIPKLETEEDERAFLEVWEAEIRHQAEHGCNVFASYVGAGRLLSDPSPFATLDRFHTIQSKYGPADTPFLCIVCQVGHQRSPEQLTELTELARRMDAWARSRGRDGFAFQGKDEARGEYLRSERPAWEAVRAGGGKVFVACGPDYFDDMGDILDFPVVSGSLRPELARKVHANGFRILSYYNPQAGIERPEIYRRNYGLALWVAGYDGALDYEYRTIDDRAAWNDFDDPHYRDHNFAYPAVGQPISTIQFAGWREGVDDIRYAATLQRAISRAREQRRCIEMAMECQTWLDGITGTEDLYALRRAFVSRLDQLSACLNR